jgi:hypothetical protein
LWPICTPIFSTHEPLQKVKAIKGTHMVPLKLTLKGVFIMGRAQGHKTRDRNKGSLPQVPKNMKSDGIDVEYSQELADQADLEATARANAANQRVTNKKRK